MGQGLRSMCVRSEALDTRLGANFTLLFLLVSEILFLTLRYDATTLEQQASGWVVLVGASPQFLRLATPMIVATLLFSGKPLWEAVRTPRIHQSDSRRLLFLTGHFLGVSETSWESGG